MVPPDSSLSAFKNHCHDTIVDEEIASSYSYNQRGIDPAALDSSLCAMGPVYNNHELGFEFADPYDPIFNCIVTPSEQEITPIPVHDNISNIAPGYKQPSQHSRPTMNEKRKENIPLLCHWPGCKRLGQPFCNKGTLKRHIETQHFNPRSFKCPYHGCTMSFNRKDNLNQHIRSAAHWNC